MEYYTYPDLDQQALSEANSTDELWDELESADDDALAEARAQAIEEDYHGSTLPSGFFFDEDRLMYDSKKGSDEENSSPIAVCSKLKITALTRDKDGNNQGRLLEFRDPDGIKKEWQFPLRENAGKERIMR